MTAPSPSATCPSPAPPGVDIGNWIEHTRAFLAQWLDDFAWNGTTLLTHVDTVAVDLGGSDALVLQDGLGQPLPARMPASDPAALAEAIEDPFTDTWIELIEAWRLTGTWLHPDITWELDQMAWHGNAAALPVGVLDQHDPTAARRFDPTRPSWSNDLGVVNFPLRPQRCLDLLADGHSPSTACMVNAVTAVVEAGVHEAMEMFDITDGTPSWSPHGDDFPVVVYVAWTTHDGQRFETTGWPTGR